MRHIAKLVYTTFMLIRVRSVLSRYSRRNKRLFVLVVLCLFGAAGVALLLRSNAATPTAAIEAEQGTRTSSVTVVTDTGASGSSAIRFGTGVTPFVHPGILLDKTQLDYVKAKIAAGAEPWTTAYNKTRTSKYAASTYAPGPVQYVGCGPSNNPDEGCTKEMDDAIAAYTQALLWYYTGQTSYAQKAIQIMDAWSATLIDHKFDLTTYTNGILQAAWVGETFTRAAEIIRYSNAGWSATNITRFETMLNNAFLPHVINGWRGGNSNWLTSMADATISIGVFTNNRTTFNAGLASWRAVVPSAIYLTTDGSEPVDSPGMNYTTAQNKSHWYNPTSYINGLSQETCRDVSHVVMGLEGIVFAAETARIQGVDLYGEQRTRIVAGYEMVAKSINQYLTGATVTNWVCPNALSVGGSLMYKLGFEVAYNAYANRLGVAMPSTLEVLGRIRPVPAALHVNWETLTTPGL